MPVGNGDWSIGGPGPGDAESWDLTGIPKGEVSAEYVETDPPGAGDLVVTCSDTFSVPDWVDPMLAGVAEYTQNEADDPDDRVEDFEAEWPAGSVFIDDLVNIVGAEFVDEVGGGTQPVDDFERDEPVFAIAGALYVDDVNGGSQVFEDFERTPDGSVLPATAAIFEGASLWESFSIDTFWGNPDDQMTTM